MSPSRFVAVGGANGTLVLTSDDGITWSSATTPAASKLRAVTWGNGQFVAVGAAGTLLTSPDGRTWTLRGCGATERLDGVMWTGSQFYILGETGKFYSSADAVTWTSSQGNPPTWIEGLAWSDTQYVAVGAGGRIATSPTGAFWTAISSGVTGIIHGVTWSGVPLTPTGNPVALTDNLRQMPALSAQPTAQTVIAGGSATYSVAASGADPIAYQWKKSGVAIGGATNAAYTVANVVSTDAGSYTVTVSNAFGSVTSAAAALTLRGQGTTGRQFVAVGASGTILTSPDGLAWTSRTSGTTKRLRAAAALGNLFVVVGETGTVVTSPDGVAWTARSSGTTETLRGVAASQSRFVAVGGASAALVLTSDDGLVWSAVATPIASKLRAVTWGNGQFVAVGAAGTILTSPDGVQWTSRNATIAERLDGVLWTGSVFQILSETGKVLGSPDGITWIAGSCTPPAWIEGLAWSDTRYVAVGAAGAIVTSTDGATWAAAASGTTATIHGLTWSGVPMAPTGNPMTLLNNLGQMPPAIMTQPASVTANLGSTVSLTVVVTGTPAPTYQWKHNGLPIPGATASTYTISRVGTSDKGYYQVVATNSNGSVTSAAAFVLVKPAVPQVLNTGQVAPAQPADLTGAIAFAGGNNHVLALKADGTVVAWYKTTGGLQYGQADVPVGLNHVVAVSAFGFHSLALKADGTVAIWGNGETLPAGGLSNVVAIAAGGYHSLALKGDGTVVAWSTSGAMPNGQSIVPAGLNNVVAVAAGWIHSLALKADGTVVAWGSNADGQTTVPAGLSNVVAIAAGYNHSLALKADGTVVAWGSNSNGQISVPAGLNNVVAITAGWLDSQALKADGSLSAWGSVPSTLSTASHVVALSSGDAFFVLRDASQDAATTRLVGLSDRQNVGTGAAVLFGAFTVEGTQPKTMLLRAVGPTLATYYVTGVLADPQLAVYDASGALVASNDDWGGTAELLAAFQQIGTFALPSTSKDAAILATFAPGTYTIKCIGANNSTGIALLEVYDADSNPRLVYLSTRANVGTGDNILIGGFIVSGTGSSQYLIRAVGASTINSAGMLGNPTLSVYSPGNTLIANNDDWGNATSAPDIATAAQTVGAQPLMGNGHDSALLLTLNPGGYTAQVSGVGNTTGIALVEIFAVDGGRAANVAPAIVSPPTPMTANLGQSAFFGVGTVGKPQPTYQWRKNGTAISGATNASLIISSVQASDAGDYTVVVANGSGSVTSPAAPLTINGVVAAPSITTQPRSLMINVGQVATFSVVASGAAPLSYQWKKDGAIIGGATDAIYNIANAASADAGSYIVVVTNGGGSTPSSGASLTLQTVTGHTGTHAVVGNGYTAGGTVTITNTLSYTGTTTSLGWSVTTAGWSFVSVGGDNMPQVVPSVGTTGTLEFAWTTPPASPVTFTYTMNVPAGTTDEQILTASAIVRISGLSPVTITVTPSPLVVAKAPLYHSADTNQDGKLSLLELTRVIELYNTRNGTSRTGCYAVQTGSEDGFTPAPTRTNSTTVTLTCYHSADTDKDGKIGLLELTRVIELYNTRSGTSRTGQYHVQAGTEDGYAPGP